MTDSNFASQSQSGKPGNLPTLHVVPFHGDSLATFEHDGERWVALRPVVEALEMSWATQTVKLTARAEQFNCFDIETVGADGKLRKMLSIPLRRFPGWLATINPNKIPNETKRAKVILYQERSFDALYDFWVKGAAIRDDMEGVVTEIDARVMAALGGMVKGIVNKALTQTVNQMVESALASDPRVAIKDFRSALEALKEHGVPQKGRHRLVLKCSTSLRSFCARESEEGGKDVSPRRCTRTNTWLFPVGIIQKWWNVAGRQLVHDFLIVQKAEQEEQNVFPFVQSKKPGTRS